MQIVVRAGRSEREVDLQLHDPHACVGDLVAAVHPAADAHTGVRVAGRSFAAEIGLDELDLYQGAVVELATGPPTPHPPSDRGPVAAVVGGPAAGSRVRLTPHPLTVGRDPTCGLPLADPTVSWRHARLERDADGAVHVCDLGSTNGTWIDGVPVHQRTAVPPGALLRLGATHLRVWLTEPDDRPVAADPRRPTTGGLVPFNRPPRPAPPPPPAELHPPAPPEARARSRAFSLVAVLAPLLVGGVLVLVYRSPRFAIFFLLSPIMAVGHWLSSRRQARRQHQRSSREFRQALDAFDQQLVGAVATERGRLEQVVSDPAEIVRRATLPSVRLWQRRPSDDDFLHLRVGLADVPWQPPLRAERDGLPAEVEAAVAAHRHLPAAPVEVDLAGGQVLGLTGDRAAAVALARSLVCQAVVHHGPADLAVAVLAAPEHAPEWDWAKWLPHARDASGAARLLAGDRDAADALLAGLLEAAAERERDRSGAGPQRGVAGRTHLFVLDDPTLTQGRRAPARLLLRGAAGPATGIVIAPTEDRLPAVCTTVVQLTTDLGDALLRRPQEGLRVEDVVIAGITEATARSCARALARYEDPELEVPGAGLPASVRLLPLLGLDDPDAAAVLRAWTHDLPDPAPATPIGVGEDGVVRLDLVRDGPHGLIGGTTGSGKSELLRSFVAGAAARADPEHLTFVLVDYKGGSAFDQCARLPHVVGLVTDLDGHLGGRALRSLEAELRHRERVLRTSGAGDLAGYLRAGSPAGPLPRLVVVVDEFATLATELPDFLGALVGIAQRGRSLGMHLVLATQRPSGAVNANIKANTNLRVALRVQDAVDSTDIIERADAATIARSQPGRAYVRRGAGDVVVVQCVLATAAPEPDSGGAVGVVPFRFGPLPSPGRPGIGQAEAESDSDLARLVDAVRAAFQRSGATPPRRPWLPMLAEDLTLDEVLGRAGGDVPVPFALADDPDRPAQEPVGWDLDEGNLALFGTVGAGTTTALRAVARALVEGRSPDDLHLYALDFGAGELGDLAALPHTGAVVTATEREAQFRLMRFLRAELDRRRQLGPAARGDEPRVVVLIDGIAAFLAEHDGLDSAEVADAFGRLFSEGPGVGVHLAVAGDRLGALPLRLSSLVSQKVLLRLADPADFSVIGVRAGDLPAFVTGRGIHAPSRLVVQVGHPGDDLRSLGATLQQRWTVTRPPRRIATLPTELAVSDLPRPARLGTDALGLVVGISDEDLGAALMPLHPGEHALVAGPPRSGVSTALALLAEQVRVADPATILVGVCRQRSPLYPLAALDAAGELHELAPILRAAVTDGRRWIVLVDDAAHVDDTDGALAALLASGRPDVHVIAGGCPDDLRRDYGHWSRPVRRSRTGILLQPDLTADGDLLQVRLPRRVAVPLTAGRGFVVSAGVARLAQLARPALRPRTAPPVTGASAPSG